MVDKKSYTVREAATATGLSEKSIRRLVARGELRASEPLVGRILITAAAIDDLLERHEINKQEQSA